MVNPNSKFIEGIRHFNSRDYFEAHEVWEEIWLLSSGETKLFYQMLIQAAVALYHYERGNFRGVRGPYRAVVAKLERLPKSFMSIDLREFESQMHGFFEDLVEKGIEAPPPATAQRPRIVLLDCE